jgi:hypothetical protein
MKLEKGNQIEFDSTLELEGKDATISAEKMHKLWDMLQNPYKDAIGSIVREIVSNAFDSHAEAKLIKESNYSEIRNAFPTAYKDCSDKELEELKQQLEIFNDDAVYVRVAKDETNWFWSVEDFGIGLSPDRIENIYTQYLSSTKEESNDVIGGWGIGSKSPLSYTNLTHITTRYNGIEYYYFLRKGENGSRIEKVYEQATDKRNGTEVKIYMEEYSDMYKFKTSCQYQLAYFENIYYEGCDISNNYKLVKGYHWVASNISPHSDLHINLGKVAYPIDWRVLEIEPIRNVPLALNFNIGELDVIQTREDLKYTKKTKEAIIEKIELLKQELIDRYNVNDFAYTDFKKFLDNQEPDYVIGLDFKYVDLTNIIKDLNVLNKPYYKPFADNNLNVNRLTDSRLKNFFNNFYTSSYMTPHRTKIEDTDFYWLYNNNRVTCLRAVKALDDKKNRFIRETMTDHGYVYIIRKKKKNPITLKNYIDILQLKNVPKNEWRTQIKSLQSITQKIVLERTESYDKLEIDEEWLKSKKVKRIVDTGVFNVNKYNITTSKTENWNFGLEKFVIKPDKQKTLSDTTNRLIILGTEKQRGALNLFVEMYYKFSSIDKKHLNYYIVAQSNLKYFQNCKNVQTMDTLMTDNNSIFKRTLTLFWLNKQPEYQKLIQIINIIDFDKLSILNSKFKDVKYLETMFCRINHNNFTNRNTTQYEFINNVCLPLIVSNNWVDEKIIEDFNFIHDYFKALPLISYINSDKLKKIDDNLIVLFAKSIRDYNKINYKKDYKKLNPNFIIKFNEWELEQFSQHPNNSIEKITFNFKQLCV